MVLLEHIEGDTESYLCSFVRFMEWKSATTHYTLAKIYANSCIIRNYGWSGVKR